MKLRIHGFKGHDRQLDLGRCNLVCGRNGSGKSEIADAIEFAALGYVSRLGKRPADTAALLRGREARVELVLVDGRTIVRTLKQAGRGYKVSTEASWLGETTATEHAAAIVRLFGRDEQEAAENLDIRRLLDVSPQQRASRIQELIGAGMNTDEAVRTAARFTVQRLAGVSDEQMPEDYAEVIPILTKQMPAAPDVLRSIKPTFRARLAETGIAGALEWANQEKRLAAGQVRDKEQAKVEIEARLRDLPVVDEGEIAALEARRTELDRQIGAIDVAQEAYLRWHGSLQKTRQEWETARQVARQVEAEYAAAQRDAAELGELENEGAVVEEEISRVAPPPPPEDTPEAIEADRIADEREAEATALTIPEPPASTAELEARIDSLRRRLKDLEGSPWQQVKAIAAKIRTKSRGASIIHLLDDLDGLADEHLDANIDALRGELDGWEQTLAAARKHAEAVTGTREAALSRQDELLATAREARSHATAIREKTHKHHRREMEAYAARQRELIHRQRALAQQITSIRDRTTVTAAKLERTRESAEQAALRVAELEASPMTTPADPTELASERERTAGRLVELSRSEAVRRQFEAIIQEIDALSVRRAVFSALEWGLKRTREQEISQARGSLIQSTDTFLQAAGRREAPYLRTENGCEIGWRTGSGDEVPIQALSGGEYALFATALTAAVLAIRRPAIGVLRVEAAETDDETLGQLLAGIRAVGDAYNAALVLTSHAPDAAPAGWQKHGLLDSDVNAAAA